MLGSSETGVSNIRRLQAWRILVAGHDRRFVRVTTFLLERRAYDVAEAELGDALAEAQSFVPHVVLLECGPSRAAAARVVTQLGALPHAPAVVLVTNDGRRLWAGQRTVAKWSPVEELVTALEAAALSGPFANAAGAAG